MASDEEIDEVIDQSVDEDEGPDKNLVTLGVGGQDNSTSDRNDKIDSNENVEENKNGSRQEINDERKEGNDERKEDNNERKEGNGEILKNKRTQEDKVDLEQSKVEDGDSKRDKDSIIDDNKRKVEKSKVEKPEDEKSKDENSKDDEEKVEGEEEEEETEMTEEEKEDMYNAVREGDLDLFQDLLDKKNSDLNMKWYNENLLMVALKAGQTLMAEFLIDIGIDYNYTASILELKDKEKTGKRLHCYEYCCRQLAQDLGFFDIVELIDVNNGNIFKYYKPRERTVMQRRPPPPPTPEEDELYDEEYNELFIEGDEGGLSDVRNTSPRKSTVDDEGGLSDVKHILPRISIVCDDGGLNDVKHNLPRKSIVGEEGGLSDVRSTSPRKSIVSDRIKDDEPENISAQDRTASEQDITTDKITELEVLDDGYGTMTPRSSYFCLAKQESKDLRPNFLQRGTKSSVGLRTFNMMKYQRTNSNGAQVPRTVNAIGSYALESKLWHREDKVKLKDNDSVESIPFLARASSAHPSKKNRNSKVTPRSRPYSSPPSFSPLSQVSKILKKSTLLNPKPEPSLPYIKTTQKNRVRPLTASTVITPWCHNNSSGVFQRLSNAKIHNNIRDSRFQVNRQLLLRRSQSYTR